MLFEWMTMLFFAEGFANICSCAFCGRGFVNSIEVSSLPKVSSPFRYCPEPVLFTIGLQCCTLHVLSRLLNVTKCIFYLSRISQCVYWFCFWLFWLSRRTAGCLFPCPGCLYTHSKIRWLSGNNVIEEEELFNSENKNHKYYLKSLINDRLIIIKLIYLFLCVLRSFVRLLDVLGEENWKKDWHKKIWTSEERVLYCFVIFISFLLFYFFFSSSLYGFYVVYINLRLFVCLIF